MKAACGRKFYFWVAEWTPCGKFGEKIIGKAPVVHASGTRQECKRAILVTSSLRDLRVPPRSR